MDNNQQNNDQQYYGQYNQQQYDPQYNQQYYAQYNQQYDPQYNQQFNQQYEQAGVYASQNEQVDNSQPEKKKSGVSTVGLILGIVSILTSGTGILGLLLAIPGLICSIKAKKNSQGGTGGLITSIVGMVFSLIALLVGVIIIGAMAPSYISYTDKSKKSNDVSQGSAIATAIGTTLCDEDIFYSMMPCVGNVYSLSDSTSYNSLPQAFRDEFEQCIGKTSSELKPEYTKDGGRGFAFEIDENYSIRVYISSKDNLREWEVYPNTSSDYR